MTQPIMIVGDIHGQYDQAAQLLDSPESQGRHLYFVGDLIDRGSQSAHVLDLACQLIESWPDGATIVRGNHEQALLDFLDTGNPSTFLKNGGLATVASYYRSVPAHVLKDFRSRFPENHRELLVRSELYFETSELLISHMGFDPRRPTARDLETMVLRPHPELFDDPTVARKLTVCGHYAQRSRRPFEDGLLVCVDTGCGTYPGGPLSAYLIPERKFVTIPAQGGE
ncbi:metallophosphoesterase family protein [Hamadaea tsunoensis]|uniref:metallophosphoesterase family protein n=1 Tax=Hamadaea tsunoensis TaxID=53368 RepID=UPI000688A54A|nr:metallophosphoesterase family protein [Hamadaea tsunoensis]